MQERQRSWSAVWDWTSCRVQASFHAQSVALEWAATASSAMAASPGCTRNAVGSSAWQKPWLEMYMVPGNCMPFGWQTTEGNPSQTWQTWGGSFLLLSAAGGCELSTNRLEEVQGSATSSLHATSLSKHVAVCTALVCGTQCSMPARLGHWQSQTSSICCEMTGQWSGRSAMSGRKTLSPPGPVSYLCSLALRIWPSFWRREDFDGMDMWNAPMVQSR